MILNSPNIKINHNHTIPKPIQKRNTKTDPQPQETINNHQSSSFTNRLSIFLNSFKKKKHDSAVLLILAVRIFLNRLRFPQDPILRQHVLRRQVWPWWIYLVKPWEKWAKIGGVISIWANLIRKMMINHGNFSSMPSLVCILDTPERGVIFLFPRRIPQNQALPRKCATALHFHFSLLRILFCVSTMPLTENSIPSEVLLILEHLAEGVLVFAVPDPQNTHRNPWANCQLLNGY